MKSIHITNARIHNLKHLDISIPKNQLVVVTGVSGSGKSSLAFDIVFEEGRRQYLQSIGMLSGLQDEDAFDHIEGLGPTVAVKQRLIRQSNPRSLVGTKTRMLSILTVLFVAEGLIPCSGCEAPVKPNVPCASCGTVESPLPAAVFSCNSPQGMCLECHGRGVVFGPNMDVLIPDPGLPLYKITASQRVKPGDQTIWHHQSAFAEHFGFDPETPYRDLPEDIQQIYIHGIDLRPDGIRVPGLLPGLQGDQARGRDVGNVIKREACPVCEGDRVGEEARRVTLGGVHIGRLAHMPMTELHAFVETLSRDKGMSSFGRTNVQVLLRKIGHLINVGLGHLTIYRPMPTLSGGEVQRLFLMSHLDSQLESIIYIFDEPTAGMHELEKAVLLDRLEELRNLGNTVIVVEHDPNTIARADHVIDLGPLAGVQGGERVCQGTYDSLLKTTASTTGQYLSGRQQVPQKTDFAPVAKQHAKLVIRDIHTNNLKNITVEIPLGIMVGIAGVSGSGKSSLVSDTLVPLLEQHFTEIPKRMREWMGGAMDLGRANDLNALEPLSVSRKLEGTEHITGYAEVLQDPIGRHHNSNITTYINVWDKIRTLFAKQPLAVERGYTPGYFSFNSDGACQECGGTGKKDTWFGNMWFSQICPVCHGLRFQEDVLEVLFEGYSIADIMNMSVTDAAHLFRDHKPIHAMLDVLARIGMGYITLGQPSPTLSGGESQRIKLARELGRRRRGHILYILDEPTTGLSPYDIAALLPLMDELTVRGNTVIVTEHDPAVLSFCDWIIELGPGGGNEGGRIIAQGSPPDLKQNPDSMIGPFLEV